MIYSSSSPASGMRTRTPGYSRQLSEAQRRVAVNRHAIRTFVVLLSLSLGLALSGCQSGVVKMAVASPPQPVSVSKVDGTFHPRHGVGRLGDVSAIVSLFRGAQTVRELNHLAAASLAVLHDHDDPELRDHIVRTYNQVAPRTEPAFTAGFDGAGLCDVDFDSPEVLGMFFDNAQSGFSTPPHWVQTCAGGEVRVEPTVYNHYHLSYEDPTIDCFDNNGMYGRGEPGNCVALEDPALEPRYLGVHVGNEVIRIRFIQDGGASPFTMHSFYNVGDEPVRFSYQNGAGDWFQWTSLNGDTIWNVSSFVINVLEVQIINAGHSTSCIEEGWDSWEAAIPGDCQTDFQPFFLDDFEITPLFQG